MRTTVLTLSLTMAVFSGLNSAFAQDSSPPRQDWARQNLSGQARARQSQFEQDPLELVRFQEPEPNPDWQTDQYDGGTSLSDAWTPDRTGVSPRYWFTPPVYGTYVQADVLFLARAHDANNQAIAVALPPGSIPNLHTDDVSLSNNFQAGGLFTLGFNMDQVSAIELTYFGLNSWSSNAQVTDPTGNLGVAGTLQNSTIDFIFSDRIAISYSSQIHNAEGNYKQTIEGLTLLAGFRYFRLAETFDINSHSSVFGTSSDYKVNATNNMVGAQVGMGYTWQWGAFNTNLLGKIGPYANLAHQNTLLQDFGNTLTLRNYRADTTPVSTLAEIQANAGYQLTNWFSLHAGYRFIWIQNVAFAPDQLDLSNSPPGTIVKSANNHLFLHGVNVGAEIRW